MQVGDKVTHSGHGKGIIIGLNQNGKNKYFEEKPLEAIDLADNTGLIEGLVPSFYDAKTYPFIVKFEKGYTDVYAEKDLKLNK